MSTDPETINLTFDDNKKEIVVEGIYTKNIVIRYDIDIDLTPLVVGLSKRIDAAVPIKLERPTIEENEKLSLVVDTVSEIIDEYNACLGNDEEAEEKIDIPNFGDEEPLF